MTTQCPDCWYYNDGETGEWIVCRVCGKVFEMKEKADEVL